MKKVVLIKLGGSVITDKEKPNTIRLDVLSKICEEISRIVKAHPEYSYIIGNGAGSFGHYEVIKHGLKDGIKKPEQWLGFTAVHASVANLNEVVSNELLKHTINVVSMPPNSLFTARNGELATTNVDSLVKQLKADLIPSVYGDIIYDSEKGCTIFSTETVFNIIIDTLQRSSINVHSVIHLTRVPGVLDNNKKVIPLITNQNWDALKQHILATEGYDITGGMKHKIESALQYAEKGIQIVIMDGTNSEQISNYLENRNFTGTVIAK